MIVWCNPLVHHPMVLHGWSPKMHVVGRQLRSRTTWSFVWQSFRSYPTTTFWPLDKASAVEFLQQPSSLSSQLGLQLKFALYRWGNFPSSHCSDGLILLLIAERYSMYVLLLIERCRQFLLASVALPRYEEVFLGQHHDSVLPSTSCRWNELLPARWAWSLSQFVLSQ